MEPKPLTKKEICNCMPTQLPGHVEVIDIKAACEWYLEHRKDYDQELEEGIGELYTEWLEFIVNEYMDYPEWLFRKAFTGVLE